MTSTTTKPKRAKKEAPATPETFVAYKGFDANLQCRGFQYEVGKTYVHSGAVVQCKSGFHVCQNPLDVLDFYGLENGNRFARVTVGGKIDRSDDKKWAAAEITVSCELTLPQIVADAIKFVKALAGGDDKVQAASGNYAKLAASGHYAQLAASGYYAKLAASGDSAKLAASGNLAKLAASGHYAQLAASGQYAQLAASGNLAKLAASGDLAKLELSGKNSAAAAVAPGSTIKAIEGCAIAICEWENGKPIGFATGVVGKDGIEAGKWYRAAGGKLVLA